MKKLPLLCLAVFLSSMACAAEPLVLPLWPQGAPGQPVVLSEATRKQRENYLKNPNAVTDITRPEIAVYRPQQPNGTSVVVAPGGGYMFLSIVNEGTKVCDWLNELGVTAVLLKYRTPTRDAERPYEQPVADALRAIALVRENASAWGVDPKRVGLLGFSAGGNLLGHVACDRPAAADSSSGAEAAALGPNFGVMIYGGGFLDKEDPTKFRQGFSVPKDAPPMFFSVSHDDKNSSLEMARFYLEYKKLGLPAELHIFTHGGHGYGMRSEAGKPAHAWTQRCEEWMQVMGWLTKP